QLSASDWPRPCRVRAGSTPQWPWQPGRVRAVRLPGRRPALTRQASGPTSASARTVNRERHDSFQAAERQFRYGRVLLRAADEIQGAETARALLLHCALVVDDLHQQARRFPASRAPDNIAAGRRVPLVAGVRQPGIEEFVPLFIRAGAEGLEIPAVLAVVLRGQLRPEFGRSGRRAVAQGNRAFAAHLRG